MDEDPWPGIYGEGPTDMEPLGCGILSSETHKAVSGPHRVVISSSPPLGPIGLEYLPRTHRLVASPSPTQEIHRAVASPSRPQRIHKVECPCLHTMGPNGLSHHHLHPRRSMGWWHTHLHSMAFMGWWHHHLHSYIHRLSSPSPPQLCDTLRTSWTLPTSPWGDSGPGWGGVGVQVVALTLP